MTDTEMIGGPISKGAVLANLLDHEDTFLAAHQHDKLWDIFVEIGRAWGNIENDSVSIKSSWREFIHAKIAEPPSYIGEYINAISVVQELVGLYGHADAFQKLFFANGIPDGAPVTRLAHAKVYVIDEFIRMQTVAGGFKGFAQPASLNYKGYVGGSRYNETPRVRAYTPKGAGQ